MKKTWSSLVDIDEGSYRPNGQFFVIVYHELPKLFWHFINATAFHLGLLNDTDNLA